MVATDPTITSLGSNIEPRADGHVHTSSDAGGHQDRLLWCKDTGQHVNGEFSMAVVQSNNLLEDQNQIESGCLSLQDSGPYGTFIEIYDGHGGPKTSSSSMNTSFKISRGSHPSTSLCRLR
ncbi:hypothetical protein HAX54_038271 [Datura stramonium]|uniref:Uncharacterized protein n=1 Tax=Datura stramonium TaxID=4076 RepID=A0ABS8VK84_DATST|nr:hypothetical protein [Datura stramonium]